MTEPRTDPRYGSRRWKAARAAVLRRDLHTCRIVPGCTVKATVADHIQPAFPGMPDSMFYGLGNLRASCRRHNLARGFAASLDGTWVGNQGPETVNLPRGAVVVKDYTG
jgi:5-methylcytosine-specific restriction endonuclease McrA